MLPNYFGDEIASSVAKHDIVLVKNLYSMEAANKLIDACHKHNKPIFYDIDDDYLNLPDGNSESSKMTDETRVIMDFMLKNVTGIIVATEPLMGAYKEWNKNIHILKNYNDISEWKYGPTKKRSDGRVCIGFAGSSAHQAEFSEYLNAAYKLWEKYGDKIVFRFDGCSPTGIDTILPKGVYEVYPDIKPFNEYQSDLPSWGYDIGVAPLAHNTFNDCKSHIKWMEYASYSIPMVGQSFGPFKRECKHEVDSLLVDSVDEWVTALSELIDDTSKRTSIGETANRSIIDNWQWKDHVMDWKKIIDRQ